MGMNYKTRKHVTKDSESTAIVLYQLITGTTTQSVPKIKKWLNMQIKRKYEQTYWELDLLHKLLYENMDDQYVFELQDHKMFSNHYYNRLLKYKDKYDTIMNGFEQYLDIESKVLPR
jgi:disulfide oxidoreductase YuzD